MPGELGSELFSALSHPLFSWRWAWGWPGGGSFHPPSRRSPLPASLPRGLAQSLWKAAAAGEKSPSPPPLPSPSPGSPRTHPQLPPRQGRQEVIEQSGQPIPLAALPPNLPRAAPQTHTPLRVRGPGGARSSSGTHTWTLRYPLPTLFPVCTIVILTPDPTPH